MRKLLSSLFAATLMFTACKKEPVTAPVSTPKNVVTTTPKNNAMAKNGRDASNISNVFDAVGQNHNMILGEVSNYLIESENATEEDVVDFMNTFCTSYYGITIDVEPYLSDTPTITNLAVRAYMEDLDAIVDDIPSYTTYNGFKSDMVSLEATIAGDNTLSSGEKELLLGTASVARYAADYWWDNASVSPNPDNRSNVVRESIRGYHAGGGIMDPSSFSAAAACSAVRVYNDFIDWWNN